MGTTKEQAILHHKRYRDALLVRMIEDCATVLTEVPEDVDWMVLQLLELIDVNLGSKEGSMVLIRLQQHITKRLEKGEW